MSKAQDDQPTPRGERRPEPAGPREPRRPRLILSAGDPERRARIVVGRRSA